MQRRIDQADGDGKSVHGLEDADEVAPLVRQELVERLLRRPSGESAMIISWMASCRSMLFSGNSKSLKNMCSVRTRPIPSAPISRAFLRIVRRIGIGPHMEFSDGIRPAHQRGEGFRQFRS